MPNIKTYDSPALDIRPTEVGVEATAAVGRRAGQFFNQMGQALGGGVKDLGDVYVQYQDHQETSRGAKDFSALMVQKDQQWRDTLKNSDPNDPTVAAKFREEELEPALEKFKEGFTTQNSQRFAEHLVDQYRTHVVHSTIADMSTQAGIAVRTNAKQTANNLASAVNLNPMLLDTSLKTLDDSLHAITASNANLTPAETAKIKTEFGQEAKKGIVHSAVIGMLDKNPNVNLDEIQKKYGEYVTGAEMQQFQKAAQAYAKRDLLQTKQIEQYQKQQAADGAHRDLSRVWTESVKFDSNGKPTIKPDFFDRIMKVEETYPGAATERTRAMINWGQAEQKEKREVIVTNPQVQSDLYTGLFRTEDPTSETDILKAAANPDPKERIDQHATSTLLSLHRALEEKPLKGPIYQGVMAAVKGSLGDSEKGHQNYAKFLQTFIPEYLQQSKAGKLPPNALDLRDPESLISKSLNPWRLTSQEKMMERIYKSMGGPPGGDINGDPFAPLAATPPKAVTLPAVDKRDVGKVYDTPRGKMKWTGTGWVAP